MKPIKPIKRILFPVLLMLGAISTRADLADAYNHFGFQLLHELHREKPQQNIFISPPSLAFALSMVANGAHGATLDQMRRTLGLTGDINAANSSLLARLQNIDPKVALDIANAIWVDQKAPIKPSFLDENQRAFHAMIVNANFQNPQTADDINLWVRQKTHDKIQDIIDPPINPFDRLILLDAVYFKGDWSSPFDPKLTHDKPFTTGDGQTIQQPLMFKNASLPYFETPQFQAVNLFYGSRALEMTVTLPRQSLDDALPSLSSLSPTFRERQGTLELPRFKLENSYKLIPALKKLGITTAFGPGADFAGISAEPLNIGEVKQKTYLRVDEQGTEAAAVTVVEVRGMAVLRETSLFQMIVDRPFLVMIRDTQSGLILFLGAIQNPQ